MSGRGGRGGGRGGGGRGEYYKNKYGGGGRGRGSRGRGEGGRGRGGGGGGGVRDVQGGDNGGSYEALINVLWEIDGQSYPRYHDIESSTRGWVNKSVGFSLHVGRAQSDPFARPTRCRVVVPASTAAFPPASYANRTRATALGDYVHRAFHALSKSMGADQGAGEGGRGWSGPKGGDVQIAEPTQHVVEQSAVSVNAAGDVW